MWNSWTFLTEHSYICILWFWRTYHCINFGLEMRKFFATFFGLAVTFPTRRIKSVGMLSVSSKRRKSGISLNLQQLWCNYDQIGWQVHSSSSIWAECFSNRYCKKGTMWNHSNPMVGSCAWKRIHILHPFLQHSSKWWWGQGLVVVWLLVDGSIISNLFPHLSFSMDDCVSALVVGNTWLFQITFRHSEPKAFLT